MVSVSIAIISHAMVSVSIAISSHATTPVSFAIGLHATASINIAKVHILRLELVLQQVNMEQYQLLLQ